MKLSALLEDEATGAMKRQALLLQQLVFDVDPEADAEILPGSKAPKAQTYWRKYPLIVVVKFSHGGQKIYPAPPDTTTQSEMLAYLKKDMKLEAPGSQKSVGVELVKALREKYGKAFSRSSSPRGGDGGTVWESHEAKVKVGKLFDEVLAAVERKYPNGSSPSMSDYDAWSAWHKTRSKFWDNLNKEKIFSLPKRERIPITVLVTNTLETKAKTGVKAYGFRINGDGKNREIALTIPEVIDSIEKYYGRKP